MIETSERDYPTVAEAEARFQGFVRGQGLSDRVVYISSDDVSVFRGRWFARRIDVAMARRRAHDAYDQAVRSARGVSFTGHCLIDDAIGVHVYGPIDDDEAERLMYPNGLKLSVGTNLPAAEVLGQLTWMLVRWRQWFNPDEMKRKTELLK